MFLAGIVYLDANLSVTFTFLFLIIGLGESFGVTS